MTDSKSRHCEWLLFRLYLFLYDREMKTAVDSAAALAYVATQIRDHGAIKEAALLLKRALDLEPFHTSCALAYIHTLQVSI